MSETAVFVLWGIGGYLLLLKNHAEALLFKRTGVQNLISAAGSGRERDQKTGFPQSEKLADGVGAGS